MKKSLEVNELWYPAYSESQTYKAGVQWELHLQLLLAQANDSGKTDACIKYLSNIIICEILGLDT